MNRNKLYRIIISDGFTPPYYVERCTNIKDFLPGSSKTGIYILHFSDETKYVGKSKEISRRFRQHSNNFSDIIAINFKEVPSDELDIAEEKTIKLLEKNKVKLRNILLSSFTYKKTDFYDVIPERDQNLWLTNLNFNDFSGERITDNELREKYKMKFHKFLREPYSDKVIAFLRLYVSKTIPFPIKTEFIYWSISCLPSATYKTFCRMNLFWQEVLTVFENNRKSFFSFHLMKSEISASLFKMLKGLCEVSNHRYKPGGEDQCNLIVESYETASEILNNEHIQNAIKKFNINLMRKGVCQYARYHCFYLADKIIENFPLISPRPY